MTPQQAKLYGYLLERIDDPVCPTFEEMSEFLGLRAKSGVSRIIDALREQGRVEPRRMRNETRSVRAVRRNPWDGVPSASLIAELKRRGDL